MQRIANPQASLNPAILMGLAPTKRFTIADGDLGTAQTIERIRKLVHDAATDQLVNRLAIRIVRGAGVPQFDFLGEARAIYGWVLTNFRFIRDVYGVETLRTVREMLVTQAGDCDDINSILLPALLMTIGFNVRLVTVAADPSDPNVFSHIYCEAQIPDGSWLPLDVARRNPAFGKGPGHWFRLRRWSLTDSTYHDLPAGRQMGLSGYFHDRRTAMGDDSTDTSDSGGFDWSALASVLGAAGSAAGNIIRAVNTPAPTIPGIVVNPATGLPVAVTTTPQGTLIASSVPGGILTSASGSIPTWMIFAGLGLGALLLLRK